jgi:hypothetical protein
MTRPGNRTRRKGEEEKRSRARRVLLLALSPLLLFFPGCAADGSFDAVGFARVVGAASGAVSDWRSRPPEGPATTYQGYYDSDGIWRPNFGP